MYQIKCDDYVLYDHRDPELIVSSPTVKLEVNTCGEGSFTIFKNHPYYDKLKLMKSIIEVSDEIGTIFRGRITNHSLDFYDGKAVDLEGLMAFFNDSLVKPFNFPDDFLKDEEYIEADESGNVVKFFLKWLIDNHNSQVKPFQRFKLGNVTVSDPNNYITRSESKYTKTWDILKSKLFESALGGYLCIRYEKNGNYIDYLSEFTLTNTQSIKYGQNMLDVKRESDGTEIYTAIVPLGADIETQVDATDADGNTTTETVKNTVTIVDLADGNITDDIVKEGNTLYSKSAVDKYGWIYAPVDKTTWNDVTLSDNLLTKATEFLSTEGVKLSNTVEYSAVDLHYTDAEIRSFRIYRKVNVDAPIHGQVGAYDLTALDLNLHNPQSTKITVGDTKLSMTEFNSQNNSDAINRIQTAEKDIEANRTNVNAVKNQMIMQSTSIVNTFDEILLEALKSYVETSNFEEFKETVTASLEVVAGEIEMNFKTTTEQIKNVDGDLQSKFEQLHKWIRYSGETAITIGSEGSAITLEIDNEKGIVFKKNDVQFGLWDGENFYTGNIVVQINERAQFGNFAFVPRTDGSLSFLKVGG